MSKYLKINDNMIIREEDKMIFSAKNMKIYKFNDKGYAVINLISNSDKITKKDLYSKLEKDYTKEEIDSLINKMVDNNIVELYE